MALQPDIATLVLMVITLALAILSGNTIGANRLVLALAQGPLPARGFSPVIHHGMSVDSGRCAYLAREDALTSLPNRRWIDEILDQSFAETRRTGEKFAVIMLDINEFKLVNDQYGHSAGDKVLRAVLGVADTGMYRDKARQTG